MTSKYKVGVLLSGSGTTLQYLVDQSKLGLLPIEIAVVIANSHKAFGVERAKEAGIPALIVDTKNKSCEEYSSDIYQVIKSKDVQLVVMAGFLKKYLPPFHDIPTINTHPSLLPSFGGKGMYGAHVHQAVFDYGCKVSGVTIHCVTDEYDTGPVIAQRCVEILAEDSVEDIQNKVTSIEKPFLASIIKLYSENKIKRIENKVFVEQ